MTPSKDRPDFWDGDIPWVSPKDMKRVELHDSTDHVSETALQETGLRLHLPGAVMVVVRGMILAHTFPVARNTLPVTVNQDMKVLRPAKGVDGRYLCWMLQGLEPVMLSLTDESAHGTKALRTDQWANLAVPVPDAAAQKHVANFLDEQTARIDRLIAEKERLATTLVEGEASQLLALVTGREHGARENLNPQRPDKRAIPDGWNLPQLARLVSKLTNGYVGPTRDILVEDGVRYLQSLHIKSGQIEFQRGEYYVTQEWSLQHAKSVLSEGDVLIVQTGDIGQTALVTEEFVGCNCHALIIATPRRDLVDPRFLELVLRSAYGRAAFALYATGALHPHLNCSNIRDIRVPTPPLDIQVDIVKRARTIQNAHRQLAAHVEAHLDRLREYRSSLISAAVTGQLDINTYKQAA
jgi:type I restriction enzyme S subunit